MLRSTRITCLVTTNPPSHAEHIKNSDFSLLITLSYKMYIVKWSHCHVEGTWFPSTLYIPRCIQGSGVGGPQGWSWLGGRNERETLLNEIVRPFVQSVNKHCTDRPCQELRRKLPACDNTNPRCNGDFPSARSALSVPAGKKITMTDILHNFPQPLEEKFPAPCLNASFQIPSQFILYSSSYYTIKPGSIAHNPQKCK